MTLQNLWRRADRLRSSSSSLFSKVKISEKKGGRTVSAPLLLFLPKGKNTKTDWWADRLRALLFLPNKKEIKKGGQTVALLFFFF